MKQSLIHKPLPEEDQASCSCLF